MAATSRKPLKTGKKRPNGEKGKPARIRRAGNTGDEANGDFEPTATSERHSERPIGSEIVTAFSHWAWVSMIVNLGNLTRVWQEIVR